MVVLLLATYNVITVHHIVVPKENFVGGLSLYGCLTFIHDYSNTTPTNIHKSQIFNIELVPEFWYH